MITIIITMIIIIIIIIIIIMPCPEQGIKLLGLLLAGSTGQHMAGRNGLA